MNPKKLIIYEYDTLFNILKEINEVLNFDLIHADKNNFDDIKREIFKDFLVLSKDQNIDQSNQLILKDTPIQITRLLELINIEFLKNKFDLQSDFNLGSYNLNLNSREISKNGVKLKLTEREINLIIFLNKSNSPVTIEELQKEVWEYNSELETHTVETHIYRLRKKINESFKDNNFIISSKKGYKIN